MTIHNPSKQALDIMLYCTFSKHPISGVSVRLTLQHVHRKCRHGYILNHYCPLPEVRWSRILCELAPMFESASYIAVWIVYPGTQCMCATGCVDLCISISLWVWLKHTGIPSCVFTRCSLVNCLPFPSPPNWCLWSLFKGLEEGETGQLSSQSREECQTLYASSYTPHEQVSILQV